jgi:hypothetical protein
MCGWLYRNRRYGRAKKVPVSWRLLSCARDRTIDGDIVAPPISVEFGGQASLVATGDARPVHRDLAHLTDALGERPVKQFAHYCILVNAGVPE